MISLRHEMVKTIKLFSSPYTFDEAVNLTANVLKSGKIVALPTDTIYGVAALAQNTYAVNKMCKIKRRDSNKKSIAICVATITDIPKWGRVSFQQNILTDLLPGPVTLIMTRTPALNPELNPNTPTIGIRIPKANFIQSVAAACGEPLALTSANVSSTTSTLAIQEFKELWPHLDLIVDGGLLGQCDPNRLGSTVVDLSQETCFKIVRSGCSLEHTVEILTRYGLKEAQ